MMDTDRCQSFFYNIGGEKAQDMLLEYGKCGDFLVRPSESNKNDYTLSVHRGDRVTHVKIPIRDGEFVLPNDLTFNNLRSLVDHLTQENVFFEPDGTVIEIRTPFVMKAMDRSALIGCDRYFHPMITGKDAEILLNSEPNGTFLLRESGSTPGEFVIGVKCSGEILHIKIFNVNGRFRVGQYGDAFKSISDLINNYMMFNMFQTNGQPVPLLYPLQSTSFFATMIDERIEYLKSASKKYPNKDNAAEEFDALQNDKEPNVFNSKREGRKQENEIKNRYKNVLPYDDSRIRLRMDSDDTKQSDYINANYIEVLHDDKFKIFDGFDKKYISTQGCLPNTIGAFWRMVWQENSKTIVMITKEVERGKVKCARYWPELDQELETGFAGEIIVKNVVEELDDNFVRREFDLTNKKTEEVRRIIHFQFLFWDDYDYPANSVQCYMDEVNKTSDEMEGEKGPMIVHCSAGIGRTGTYMVIDILIGVLKRNGLNWPIDVAKAVRMVREQRDQMVQNENQYKFIYEAVRAFIHSMMKNDSGKKNGTHATLLNNFNQLQIHGNGNDKATTPSPCSIANSPNPFSHGGSGSSSSSYSNNSIDLNCQISFTDPQPIVLSPPPRPKKKRPPPIPEHSNNPNQNYVNSN